jgi:hypothetical protein
MRGWKGKPKATGWELVIRSRGTCPCSLQVGAMRCHVALRYAHLLHGSLARNPKQRYNG